MVLPSREHLLSVRLIAGRAGSGKTHTCLAQITAELTASLMDGPRLILLVPEQAALQMERALVRMSPARTLGRCEVLSFRRLARRILDEAAGRQPRPLTPLGRQMALRHLISRHGGALAEFRKVADRAGFIETLAGGIAELLQESVTIDHLDAAAERAAAEKDPTAPRLHDVALLYRAYLDYLGDQRVDPDGLLDLARARLEAARWLCGSRIWIDGFAGLTQQQLRLVVELGRRAEQLQLALLLDPERRDDRGDEAPDDLSLFARTERTWAGILRSLIDAGVAVDEPLVLKESVRRRFAAAPEIGGVERDLFHVPLSRLVEPEAGTARAGSTGRIRLVTAPDPRAEVNAAVRAILDLVQSPARPLRYREIAIVVRDLEPYHDLLSAALTTHGIPFFIDRRRPVHHHPLVQLVRAALAMLSGRAFDQAIALLLKSGLTGLKRCEADELENYLLAHGLSTARAWEEAWIYPPPGLDMKAMEKPHVQRRLARIVASRDRLRGQFDAWWPAAGSSVEQVCREWARQLAELLERFGVRRTLGVWSRAAEDRGGLDEAAEHEQAWIEWTRLLDELAEMLGEEPMSARQFRDCLESGLSQLTLGLVPPTLDQVLVGSVERSRHPELRAVFILGFADGQFPARIGEEELLADDERAYLSQAGVEHLQTRTRRILDERMLAYIAVTRPSEFLWVSYARTSADSAKLEASPYWAHLRAAAPGAPVEEAADRGWEAVSTRGELIAELAQRANDWTHERLAPDESDAWLATMHWAAERPELREPLEAALAALSPMPQARLSPELVRTLWEYREAGGRVGYLTNPAALEQFAWCPFQHFANRGLRLAERERHEIGAMHYGDLYHRALEQFVNELIEGEHTLGDLKPEEIATRLDRICDKLVPEYANELRMEERERRRAAWRGPRVLRPALRGQQTGLGGENIQHIATEQVFGLEGKNSLPALQLETSQGRTVWVRGKIDRIDIVSTDHGRLGVVFDYKATIRKRLPLTEVYHGLALQLLSYLLVLRDHGEKLGGGAVQAGAAFYLPLLAHLASVEHPDDAKDGAAKAFKEFIPRGVFDFDWIAALAPKQPGAWNSALQVFVCKDGTLGKPEDGDAVATGTLPKILEFVHGRISALADEWLSGDVSVAPARLGKQSPCPRCPYRSVCRFEYASGTTRRLEVLLHTAAAEKMAAGPGDSHA